MEPRLYSDLASWWPLLSAPAEYEEEAAILRHALEATTHRPIREVLELGSGGGNNASHLKTSYQLTLVDRSPGMLEVSRALNPECEHALGDMRTIHLGRSFDAVFVHDDTTETWRPETSHGGHDGDGRAMRYLQWSYDPDPGDTWFVTSFAFLLREGDDMPRIESDEHRLGLFPRDTWLHLLAEVGFEPVTLPFPHSSFPANAAHELFLGRMPA